MVIILCVCLCEGMEGVVYLTTLRRPTDIGLQLGKACFPCSRFG